MNLPPFHFELIADRDPTGSVLIVRTSHPSELHTIEAHTSPQPSRIFSAPKLTSVTMALVNAPNKVPEHQKFYQAAYRQHTRLWHINPRSRYFLVPYYVALWGCAGCTIYMLGRKVAGHNTWFGKD